MRRPNRSDALDEDGEDKADEGESLATVHEIWPTFAGNSSANPPTQPFTAPAKPQTSQTRLNEKYTFDTFVIGSSNRFAHAAAVAVAEAPARAYNPLFIWGESGLGKTHLLHAVGHYAQRLFPGMRVRYVSTEEFTNDFINSLRDDRKVAFQRRYRDVDVLLVDDIQFLEGKEGTQEEFFHTFNTLHNANKQIVVSSDRPPKGLGTLEDRLRTRFEWGLITDIQPPELETRIAILRKKAAQDRLNVPAEVLEFIADRIERNIRELEGALIRVTAFASLNRQPVDVQLAEIVLRDLISDSQAPEITALHDHGGDRRVLRGVHRRPVRAGQDQGARPGAADLHVSVPRADRAVAAQDRADLRRPRPHHGDARGQEDPQGDGRAPPDLRPGAGTDLPDQAARPRLTTGNPDACEGPTNRSWGPRSSPYIYRCAGGASRAAAIANFSGDGRCPTPYPAQKSRPRRRPAR